MGQIRTFVETDIARIAPLHRAVFKTDRRPGGAGLEAYHAYLTRVFLENPVRDPALPSLVHEEADGRISGFLGVVPRRLTMNGRRYQAAISSQFVVEPSSHAGLVALRLARAFLEGPQDLSISDEANDTSRKIWEGLGGTTAMLHSLYWTRPLRPARLALSMLRGHPRLAPLAFAAAPVAPVIDALATRIRHSQLHRAPRDVSVSDDLTGRAVLACLPRCTRAGSLRVDYDEAALAWVLDAAKQRKRTGSLRTTVVRKDDRVIGWYLYHVDGRIADVLQIASEPGRVREVLDQLFYQAGCDGAIAATGRLDPRHLQAFSDRYCLLHRRGPWVLLSTRHAELLRSFESGDASFSRLDGEWCLGF
jgi:hypothetical protein